MTTLRSRRHLLALITLAALSVLGAACGGGPATGAGRVAGPTVTYANVSTPELEQVDEKLAQVETSTHELKQRVDALQDKVASKIGPTASEPAPSATKLFLTIDRNSVLRANGIVMSQTEFTKYLHDRDAEFCTQPPVLVVDAAANYDTVAWVLESAYAAGCTNIDIQEQSAAK